MKRTPSAILKEIAVQLSIACGMVLLALVSGCATAKQTEDLLMAAGFKAQPAITQPQQAHLRSLPAHKVTPVQRDGQQYYIYPDLARNVLYVGQSAQYEQYRKLFAKELAEEKDNPAEQMQVDKSLWGNW